MRSIKTCLSIVLAVIAMLAFPALAEDAAAAFDTPTAMACAYDVSPTQSVDVLATSEVFRMSPVPGADNAIEIDQMTAFNSAGAAVLDLPLGGAAGHSTALGIRPEQT